MNPSGSGTFFLDIFFITNLISLTDIGLFRLSVSSCLSVGRFPIYQMDLVRFIRVIKFIDIVVVHKIPLLFCQHPWD